MPEIRHSYRVLPLVNDVTQQVEAIYMSEPTSHDDLRIGVTCQTSQSTIRGPVLQWESEYPLISPFRSPQVDDWHFSKECLAEFDEFQACLSTAGTEEYCIGLLLHGSSYSRTLGQWRWDKHVTDRISLPSDYVLETIVHEGRPQVMLIRVAECSPWDHMPLAGYLEWWTGPKDTHVSQWGMLDL